MWWAISHPRAQWLSHFRTDHRHCPSLSLRVPGEAHGYALDPGEDMWAGMKWEKCCGPVHSQGPAKNMAGKSAHLSAFLKFNIERLWITSVLAIWLWYILTLFCHNTMSLHKVSASGKHSFLLENREGKSYSLSFHEKQWCTYRHTCTHTHLDFIQLTFINALPCSRNCEMQGKTGGFGKLLGEYTNPLRKRGHYVQGF